MTRGRKRKFKLGETLVSPLIGDHCKKKGLPFEFVRQGKGTLRYRVGFPDEAKRLYNAEDLVKV